jgi:hypothetical protein
LVERDLNGNDTVGVRRHRRSIPFLADPVDFGPPTKSLTSHAPATTASARERSSLESLRPPTPLPCTWVVAKATPRSDDRRRAPSVTRRSGWPRQSRSPSSYGPRNIRSFTEGDVSPRHLRGTATLRNRAIAAPHSVPKPIRVICICGALYEEIRADAARDHRERRTRHHRHRSSARRRWFV